MAADPIINLTRGIRGAAARATREDALDTAGTPASAAQHGAMVTIDTAFATGYDTGTGETTHPFTVDVSIVGGDDIVTA